MTVYKNSDKELHQYNLRVAGIYGSWHMEDGVKNTAEAFNRPRPKIIVSVDEKELRRYRENLRHL